MIQPLRTWHRRAAFTLAGLLPVVFVAGLLARKAPAPRNTTVAWERNMGGQTQWRSAAPVRVGKAQVSVRRSDDGTWLEIRPSELLQPDVLVYWSATAPGGNALPGDSRLLGAIAARRMKVPAEGYAILYSLAHQNVIGVIRLRELP
jgi:hypothetical protein